jgi:uracil-DNA glycosylase
MSHSYSVALARFRQTHSGGWADLAAFGEPATEAARRADADVAAGQRVLPDADRLFAALELTPCSQVRAVILGQDPYPTRGNAQGLAFSVPPGRPVPASLRTIFRSLALDFGLAPPVSGDLTAWARRGVLLLNTILTVREGAAGSHRTFGWQAVSEAVISAVAAQERPVAFLLWGGPARKHALLIDASRHAVVTCTHPSPLNQRKGGQHPFLDARPFLAANQRLAALGAAPIDWSL